MREEEEEGRKDEWGRGEGLLLSCSFFPCLSRGKTSLGKAISFPHVPNPIPPPPPTPTDRALSGNWLGWAQLGRGRKEGTKKEEED